MVDFLHKVKPVERSAFYRGYMIANGDRFAYVWERNGDITDIEGWSIPTNQ